MAEWERLAAVTVLLWVRILLVSQDSKEFLQFRVARASDLFASSEGYMCYCIGQAKLLLFHSCELQCFKPRSSLSSVLFTANIERIQRNWSQTRRRATQSSVTWVDVIMM